MSLPPTGRRRTPTRLARDLGLLTLLAASAWLAWRVWERPRSTYYLKVTGGSAPGTKHRLAEYLAGASRAAGSGVHLELSECAGSIQALDQVARGEVDIALVQGGLDSSRWRDVRQVATLQIEPLQLAVKAELAGKVEESLSALEGRTVNLGEPGSGTETLSRQLLKSAGLRASEFGRDGGYKPRDLSHERILEIKALGELPDAVFAVSSLPTPVIQHLVGRWTYQLVPLPFGKAFAQANLLHAGRPEPPDLSNAPVQIDGVHLREAEIPAFTYGIASRVPPVTLPTFGARVLVVAKADVPAEAIHRLLEVIYDRPFAEVAIPPLDGALLDEPPEFPLHPGTVEFQKRNKPLILGDALDFLDKTSSFVGALLGGSFVAWRWAVRRYRRRRELGFEAYLLKVTAIEQEALRLELASKLELAALLELQGDLGKLKEEALGRFTDGELEGEGLMSGFLTHANDARDYLARLILHARTVVEKQARRQGLAPEDAWALAIGGEDRPADLPAADLQKFPG